MKTDSNPFLKWRQTFVLTFHVHPVIILLMFVNFIYEASASNQAFKDFKKSDPCPSEPHKWMDRYLNKQLLFSPQSCPTLLRSHQLQPPGSSVHGISQTRILEWVAMSFSKGYPWPSDQIRISCIAGRFITAGKCVQNTTGAEKVNTLQYRSGKTSCMSQYLRFIYRGKEGKKNKRMSSTGIIQIFLKYFMCLHLPLFLTVPTW